MPKLKTELPEGLRYPIDMDIERYKSFMTFRLGTTKAQSYIYLPTPKNLSFNTNVKYNDISLGVVEGLFDEFRNEIQSNNGQITVDTMGSAFVNTADAFVKGTINNPSVKERGLSAQIAIGSAVFKKLGGNALRNFTEPLALLSARELRNAGVAVNPNTELYFKDVGLRSFTFSFRLVARSPKEYDVIQRIIRAFETTAHPNGGIGDTSFLLEYPDECLITFYEGTQPNNKLPSINKSVITNFSHVYNAETNAFMRDGAPVSVDMSITVQETKINTKKNINKPQDITANDLFTSRNGPVAGQDLEFKVLSDTVVDKVKDVVGIEKTSQVVGSAKPSNFGIVGGNDVNLGSAFGITGRNTIGF